MRFGHLPPPETVRFTGRQNDTLVGVLHLPTGKPQAYALYAPCFTCNKDIPVAVRLCRALAQRGFGVLRFDPTGLGESGGNFSNSDFETEVEDILFATEWMRAQNAAPRVLIGHSLGGAAMLEAAAHIPQARAIVTIGTPATLDHLADLLESVAEPHLPNSEIVAIIGGQRFAFKSNFIDILKRHEPTVAAAKLQMAYLIMHAPKDTVVPYAHAQSLFQAASDPRAFISLDDADHLLRKQSDIDYCADVIAAWAVHQIPNR